MDPQRISATYLIETPLEVEKVAAVLVRPGGPLAPALRLAALEEG